MTTPNPTPTTLRDNLPQIMHDLWESAQGKEPRITKHKATQSIQEQLKALLPEKKRSIMNPARDYIQWEREKSFNEAIDQIEKAIDDFCSGKGKE